MNVLYTNPATGRIISFDRFKDRPEDDRESVKLVAKAYMKWGGLPYSQCELSRPFLNLSRISFVADFSYA